MEFVRISFQPAAENEKSTRTWMFELWDPLGLRTGLPQYPATGGVSVSLGGPDGAVATLRPPW